MEFLNSAVFLPSCMTFLIFQLALLRNYPQISVTKKRTKNVALILRKPIQILIKQSRKININRPLSVNSHIEFSLASSGTLRREEIKLFSNVISLFSFPNASSYSPGKVVLYHVTVHKGSSNWHYYSFKIFLCFWLANSTRITRYCWPNLEEFCD